MSDTAAAPRLHYIDWLRAAATIAVVALHVLHTPMSMAMPAEFGIGRSLAYTWLQTVATRWAVPVFLMMTGALLLRPEKAVEWPRLKSYILRILKALAVFGYAYCVIELAENNGEFSASLLWTAFVQLVSGRSWSHMWYVYALLGIYLLFPLLKRFADSAGKEEYRRLLAFLFLISIIVPAVNYNFGLSLVSLFPFPVAAFYVLLGGYAHRFALLSPPHVILGFSSLAIMLTGEHHFVTHMNGYGARFFDYNSPFIVLYSYMLFLAAKRYLNRPMASAPLTRISRLSFGIYLTHPIFVNAFNKLLPPMPMPAVALEISQFLLAFLCAVLLTAFLAKLPGFRSFL